MNYVYLYLILTLIKYILVIMIELINTYIVLYRL